MNILLLTESTSTLSEDFKDQGRNIVTVMTPTQLRNSGPTSCDLIIIYKITNTSAYSTDIISLVESTGVPVIIGYIDYGAGGLGVTGNSALTMLGLATDATDSNSLNTNTVYSTHEMFTKNGLELNSTFYPYIAAEYMSIIGGISKLPYDAKVLSQVSTNQFSAVYYPKNMLTLDQKRLKADIIFLGFLSPRISLTDIGKSIILSVVEFLSVKRYHIKGSVKNSSQSPLVRTIYLLDQNTMMLKDKTISNAVGEYEFLVRDQSSLVVICTPNTITNNAHIKYNIIPEEREDV